MSEFFYTGGYVNNREDELRQRFEAMKTLWDMKRPAQETGDPHLAGYYEEIKRAAKSYSMPTEKRGHYPKFDNGELMLPNNYETRVAKATYAEVVSIE